MVAASISGGTLAMLRLPGECSKSEDRKSDGRLREPTIHDLNSPEFADEVRGSPRSMVSSKSSKPQGFLGSQRLFLIGLL
jgi:hypothetical protein